MSLRVLRDELGTKREAGGEEEEGEDGHMALTKHVNRIKQGASNDISLWMS
jgi:hypothetical protein